MIREGKDYFKELMRRIAASSTMANSGPKGQEIAEKLGKSIQNLRKSHNLTQEVLAYKVRVTPKYIQFIEAARRKPSGSVKH